MKKIVLLTFLTLFALASLANAEIQTYEGTGEYIMSDFETPDIAKQRAKARAEQNAVEQAGVYVKSYTRTVNSVVAEDEVIAIANTIIKVNKVDYTTTPVNDSGGSFRIVAKIQATVDSAKIDAWLKRSAQENTELIEQNKQLQQEKVKQDAEIAELRKKLANVTNEQEKKKLEKDVISEDRKFLSNQKVEEGLKYYDRKDIVTALKYFNEAIELHPSNANAYFGRSRVQFALRKWKESRDDLTSAIACNPNFALAYYLRGLSWISPDDIQQQLRALKEGNTEAWNKIQEKNNDYARLAIADFSCAITIRPEIGEAYYNRGLCYRQLKQYKKAISDFEKAVSLGLEDKYDMRNAKRELERCKSMII